MSNGPDLPQGGRPNDPPHDQNDPGGQPAPSEPGGTLPPHGQPIDPPPPDTTAGGPPPPMPPVREAATGRATAGVGIRFGAKILDGLIVGIPMSIVLAILGVGTASYVATVVQTAVFLGYVIYFESSTGATIGKRLLNLSVVDETGGVPSPEAAFKRNAYGLLSLIPTFIGGLLSLGAAIAIAVTISTDEHNRGLHDQFAGTGVMRG